MASNLYGYNDYSGPSIVDKGVSKQALSAGATEPLTTSENPKDCHPVDDYDDEDHDPLRSGLWMEGDSLAPPCGTSVSTIHKILRLASVSSEDILYDFGCGDGRVCLEALVNYQCRHCVGVEIELDLVERFQHLVATTLPPSILLPTIPNEPSTTPSKQKQASYATVPRIIALHSDLRDVLSALLEQLVTSDKKADEDKPVSETTTDTATIATKTATNPLLQNLPIPTVIFLYLLPEAIAELEPNLISLLQHIPCLRLVMNTWGLTSVPASQTVQVLEDDAAGVTSQILIYNRQSLMA